MENTVPTKRTPFQGPCYLKVLVNNLVAGAIIGKNGTVIASIEQQTGCALKLSPANMYYPGTQDRILIMSGEQEALNNALLVVIEKIHDTALQYGLGPDGTAVRNDTYDPVAMPSGNPIKITLKIVVPKTSVAAIIGKGGQQIRDLQETTNAKVTVSNREEALVERMVTITGTADETRAASLAIASCVQSDVNLKTHMYVMYRPGGPMPMGGMPMSCNQGVVGYGAAPYGHSGYSPMQDQQIMSHHCEISIQVPETVVGAVIGRSGFYVSEVMKATQARVNISKQGDFVPGTTDRKIVISGTVAAVHNAHIMLLQRVISSQESMHPGNGMHSNGMAAVEMQQPQPQQPGGMMMQGNMQYMHPTSFPY